MPRRSTEGDALASADASTEVSERDLKEGERRRAGELDDAPPKNRRSGQHR